MIKIRLNLQTFGDENPNPNEETMTAEDFIKQVDELKANSVSKEQYEKILNENKMLAKKYIESSSVNETKQEEVRTAEDLAKEKVLLRQELYGPKAKDSDMTNLDYIKKTLQLRANIIESGGKDPFLPNGVAVPEDADVDKAKKVAEELQKMVDESNGNPDTFRILYNQRVNDVKLPPRR